MVIPIHIVSFDNVSLVGKLLEVPTFEILPNCSVLRRIRSVHVFAFSTLVLLLRSARGNLLRVSSPHLHH